MTQKAQTLQQKMGFADDDLRTPKHDEIMLWLDQHVNEVSSTIVGEPIEMAQKIWEKPVMSGNYIVGFVDLFAFTHEGYGQARGFRSHGICFEVKTSIPSLGELIRQITMYRQYVGRRGEEWGYPLFVVVSPDARFADALKSQGIEFYHYSPDPADVAMMR